MTEEEWQVATDSQPMLEYLAGKATDRKLRLFGLQCCRQIGDLFQDHRFQDAMAVAERYLDGAADESVRAAAESSALDAYDSREVDEFDDYLLAPAALVAREYSVAAALSYSRIAADAACFADEMSFEGIDLELVAEQCDFLRDIFGNPFRPIALDPSCRTSTVVAIAKGMYESRDFSAMPILADALQDAGCEHADMLQHCRGPGPHVKGCWVVDLVLGKE